MQTETSVSVQNLSALILSLLCIVVYGIFVPRLFRRAGPEKVVQPKLAMALLFTGLPLWCIAHAAFYSAAISRQIAAVVMGCTSFGLFLWAYRQHGTQMPGRIFSPDVPSVIITTGPYARVRHPIYAAYLLFHLGLVVGTGSLIAALLWLMLAAIYESGARQEDAMLAASAHADLYRRYMQQSGRLLPWHVWRKREV